MWNGNLAGGKFNEVRYLPKWPNHFREWHGYPGSCPGAWCKSVALYAAPGG